MSKKPKTYEETIALNPEDDAAPETPRTYQETVALEPDGDDAPRKPRAYQETVALDAVEDDAPSGGDKTYQETVALEPDEDDVPPRPKSYQETVALDPDEEDVPARPETYQETVALDAADDDAPPRKPDTYQETVALDEVGDDEDVAPRRPDVPEDIVETVILTGRGDAPGPSAARKTYEETIALAPTDEDEAPSEEQASALEREYYRESVRKGEGGPKYRVRKKLVSGGMGSILTVQDRDLQRTSAMKVILPKFKSDPETLRSFVVEARLTGLLEHPNIIPVHELGFSDAAGLYFTMKLAHGEALSDILEKLAAETPAYVEKYNTYQLLNIFKKVCESISFAHSRHIIHQDIKPQNVIVGDYGEVLLMDWGLARFIGDPEDAADPVVREMLQDILRASGVKSKMIKGSPSFMSPEQARGVFRELDRQSDVFLLGAALYQMFTLEAPYFGDSLQEVLDRARARDLIPPDARNPARQIPEEICRIIMKAMAAEKADRYPDADALIADVDDLIAGKWTQQEQKTFETGDMLMKEGDAGEEAYLILDGEVQVSRMSDDRKIVLGALKEGDIVGEMSLIAEEKRSASVEALRRTRAAILTKEILSQNLKKLPPYMEKIVSTLTGRLRLANTLIHPHAGGDCTHVVLKQLRLLMIEKSGFQLDGFDAPFEEIAAEISEDLGLSLQKVRDVLSEALDQGVIAKADDRIAVPDLDALKRFAQARRTPEAKTE